MAQAIRFGGFDLEVNKCVNCGSKKNIVAFSFVEGGFICQNCLNETIDRDLNKNQMVLLRKIFNSRDLCLLETPYNYDEAYILFKKFINFIEEAFGYHFKNLRLLLD
jgi:DNA repair protein RecO